MSKTRGTVTVLLTIPWTGRVGGPEDIERSKANAEEAFHRAIDDASLVALPHYGFDTKGIETTATFEADQDPGGEG